MPYPAAITVILTCLQLKKVTLGLAMALTTGVGAFFGAKL